MKKVVMSKNEKSGYAKEWRKVTIFFDTKRYVKEWKKVPTLQKEKKDMSKNE